MYSEYQKLMQSWMDLFTRFTPPGAMPVMDSVPPDLFTQMREAYFGVIGKQFDEFFRMPQVLEMTRQWTDAMITMRQQTNDFLAQSRHAVGGVARQDLDSVLMAVRRCETRILDRLDELSARLDKLENGEHTRVGANGRASRKPR